jgi:hypothetical protein
VFWYLAQRVIRLEQAKCSIRYHPDKIFSLYIAGHAPNFAARGPLVPLKAGGVERHFPYTAPLLYLIAEGEK